MAILKYADLSEGHHLRTRLEVEISEIKSKIESIKKKIIKQEERKKSWLDIFSNAEKHMANPELAGQMRNQKTRINYNAKVYGSKKDARSRCNR